MMCKYILVFLTLVSVVQAQTQTNVEIVPGCKDMNVSINDSLIENQNSLKLFLKPGKYLFAGNKENMFTDYELVHVKANKNNVIKLSPRSHYFQIGASIIPFLFFDNHNMRSICLTPGFKSKNFYVTGDFSMGLEHCLYLIGTHVGYSYDYENVVSIGLGAFITYYDFKNGNFVDMGYMSKDYPENMKIDYHGVSAGPEIKFSAGLEHLFFSANFYSIFFKGFVPIVSVGINFTL